MVFCTYPASKICYKLHQCITGVLTGLILLSLSSGVWANELAEGETFFVPVPQTFDNHQFIYLTHSDSSPVDSTHLNALDNSEAVPDRIKKESRPFSEEKKVFYQLPEITGETPIKPFGPRGLSVSTDELGNVQCASADGKNCSSSVPKFNQPLQCGIPHNKQWGGSGFESRHHWCSTLWHYLHDEISEADVTTFKSLKFSDANNGGRTILYSPTALAGDNIHQMNFSLIFSKDDAKRTFAMTLGAEVDSISAKQHDNDSDEHALINLGYGNWENNESDIYTLIVDLPAYADEEMKLLIKHNDTLVETINMGLKTDVMGHATLKQDSLNREEGSLENFYVLPISIKLSYGAIHYKLGDLARSSHTQGSVDLSEYVENGVPSSFMRYSFSSGFNSSSFWMTEPLLSSIDEFVVVDQDGEERKVDGFFTEASAEEEEELSAYWKPTKARGAGTIADLQCGPGEEKDAGLCYPKCTAGYDGVGPACWQECPSGYTDTGVRCERTYGNGVGHVMIQSCPGDRPDFKAGLCYKRCPWGYHTSTLGMCLKDRKPWHWSFHAWDYTTVNPGTVPYLFCGAGLVKKGSLCFKPCQSGYSMWSTGNVCSASFTKRTYVRNAGTIPNACPEGKEYDAGLCYNIYDKEGYTCSGPVCWKQCDPGYIDAGARCAESLTDAICGEFCRTFEKIHHSDGSIWRKMLNGLSHTASFLKAMSNPYSMASYGVSQLMKTDFPKETLLNNGMSDSDADKFIQAYDIIGEFGPAVVDAMTGQVDLILDPLILAGSIPAIVTRVESLKESGRLDFLDDIEEGNFATAAEGAVLLSEYLIFSSLDNLDQEYAAANVSQMVDPQKESNNKQMGNEVIALLNEKLKKTGLQVGETSIISKVKHETGGEPYFSDVDVMALLRHELKGNRQKYLQPRKVKTEQALLAVFKAGGEKYNIDQHLKNNQRYQTFKQWLQFVTLAPQQLCDDKASMLNDLPLINTAFVNQPSEVTACLNTIQKEQAEQLIAFGEYYLQTDDVNHHHLGLLRDSLSKLAAKQGPTEVNVAGLQELGYRHSVFIQSGDKSKIIMSQELISMVNNLKRTSLGKQYSFAEDLLVDNYIEELGHSIQYNINQQSGNKSAFVAQVAGDEGSRFRYFVTNGFKDALNAESYPRYDIEDKVVMQNPEDNQKLSVYSYSSSGVYGEIMSAFLGSMSDLEVKLKLVSISLNNEFVKKYVGIGNKFILELTYKPGRVKGTKYYAFNAAGEGTRIYDYRGSIDFAFVDKVGIHAKFKNEGKSKIAIGAGAGLTKKYRFKMPTYLDSSGIVRVKTSTEHSQFVYKLEQNVEASIGISRTKSMPDSVFNQILADTSLPRFLKSQVSNLNGSLTLRAEQSYAWNLSDSERSGIAMSTLIIPNLVITPLVETVIHAGTKGKFLKKKVLVTGVGPLVSNVVIGGLAAGLMADKKTYADKASFNSLLVVKFGGGVLGAQLTSASSNYLPNVGLSILEPLLELKIDFTKNSLFKGYDGGYDPTVMFSVQDIDNNTAINQDFSVIRKRKTVFGGAKLEGYLHSETHKNIANDDDNRPNSYQACIRNNIMKNAHPAGAESISSIWAGCSGGIYIGLLGEETTLDL